MMFVCNNCIIGRATYSCIACWIGMQRSYKKLESECRSKGEIPVVSDAMHQMMQCNLHNINGLDDTTLPANCSSVSENMCAFINCPLCSDYDLPKIDEIENDEFSFSAYNITKPIVKSIKRDYDGVCQYVAESLPAITGSGKARYEFFYLTPVIAASAIRHLTYDNPSTKYQNLYHVTSPPLPHPDGRPRHQVFICTERNKVMCVVSYGGRDDSITSRAELSSLYDALKKVAPTKHQSQRNVETIGSTYSGMNQIRKNGANGTHNDLRASAVRAKINSRSNLNKPSKSSCSSIIIPIADAETRRVKRTAILYPKVLSSGANHNGQLTTMCNAHTDSCVRCNFSVGGVEALKSVKANLKSKQSMQALRCIAKANACRANACAAIVSRGIPEEISTKMASSSTVAIAHLCSMHYYFSQVEFKVDRASAYSLWAGHATNFRFTVNHEAVGFHVDALQGGNASQEATEPGSPEWLVTHARGPADESVAPPEDRSVGNAVPGELVFARHKLALPLPEGAVATILAEEDLHGVVPAPKGTAPSRNMKLKSLSKKKRNLLAHANAASEAVDFRGAWARRKDGALVCYPLGVSMADWNMEDRQRAAAREAEWLRRDKEGMENQYRNIEEFARTRHDVEQTRNDIGAIGEMMTDPNNPNRLLIAGIDGPDLLSQDD